MIGKARTHRGRQRRRISCFSVSSLMVLRVSLLAKQQHTALAVSFVLLREAILLLKRFFQGSQFGKERFNYSHPLQITPVDCRCVLHLASCFLALYICIPLLICHHCKQKVQSISQLVMRSRLVFSLPSRLFAVAADPIFIYLFQSGKSRTRTTAGS